MCLRPCLFALLLALPAACLAQRAFPYGASLDGQPLPQLAPQGTKAVVLFFIATDCPLSNRAFPDMRRLAQTFTSQGVQFWFVYPNATEKLTDIRTHQVSFDPTAPHAAITDPTSSLVKLTHAIVTPEAAILLPAGNTWRPVYTGRIDDRFIRIGLARPAPTERLTERALTQALAGRPVTPDPGPPVGCSIVSKEMLVP